MREKQAKSFRSGCSRHRVRQTAPRGFFPRLQKFKVSAQAPYADTKRRGCFKSSAKTPRFGSSASVFCCRVENSPIVTGIILTHVPKLSNCFNRPIKRASRTFSQTQQDINNQNRNNTTFQVYMIPHFPRNVKKNFNFVSRCCALRQFH